jgi:hypothetical protein
MLWVSSENELEEEDGPGLSSMSPHKRMMIRVGMRRRQVIGWVRGWNRKRAEGMVFRLPCWIVADEVDEYPTVGKSEVGTKEETQRRAIARSKILNMFWGGNY